MTKYLKDFFSMTLGTILLAAGVYFFKIPNGFSTGGVSGISIVMGKLVPSVSSATWLLIINALLLIVGFIFLGRENGIKTVYCSMAYSFITWVFERCIPLSRPLTDQPLLELIYAMMLTSIAAAIIFNSHASSGGTDVAALILKKYTKMNVGRALLATDFVIAASSFFVFGIKTGLYSMLGLFAKAFLVDSIIESINSCKYFIVVTEKNEEVTDFIIKTLHHGVTTNIAVGEFSGNKKYMIHTVCRRIEAIRLKSKIAEIDPHAFTIITTTSEIIGRGFRAV